VTAIDWAIVAAYFILSVGIGLYFTKRGGESLNELLPLRPTGDLVAGGSIDGRDDVRG